MTPTEARAVASVARAIVDTIREVGRIPSGHLYAALAEHGCTLAVYESIVGAMIDAGAVRREGDVLIAARQPTVN